MQFSDNKHRGSGNSINHTERPIYETSVYNRFCLTAAVTVSRTARKAERKEQPQSLKSCIISILVPVLS